MDIKYHDNSTLELMHQTVERRVEHEGKELILHELANNWNPNAEYGENEYAKVYFRIDTKGYVFKEGAWYFETNNERDLFYNSTAESLMGIGWKANMLRNGIYSRDLTKDKASLDLHPQEVVGVVLKREIKQIAEILNNYITTIRWVDVYETVFDMTDDEYLEYLKEKKEEIKNHILGGAKTKRKNKYVNTYDLLIFVAGRVNLSRVGDTYYDSVTLKLSKRYIKEIINELVVDGFLVQVKDDVRDLVRTINKTEQKERKIKLEV